MADHRKSEQHARLKNALRENLKRRKAQAKGRADALRGDADEERDPDAGDTTGSGREG